MKLSEGRHGTTKLTMGTSDMTKAKTWHEYYTRKTLTWQNYQREDMTWPKPSDRGRIYDTTKITKERTWHDQNYQSKDMTRPNYTRKALTWQNYQREDMWHDKGTRGVHDKGEDVTRESDTRKDWHDKWCGRYNCKYVVIINYYVVITANTW